MNMSSAVGLLIIGAATGCAPSDSSWQPGEFNQGTVYTFSPLVAVQADRLNVAAQYRPLLDAVGQLSGFGACTATHIGDGLAMTAAHCFLGDNVDNVTETNTQCSGFTVTWGKIAGSSTSTSNCIQILQLQKQGLLDFAVFQVDQIPDVEIGFRPNAGDANSPDPIAPSSPGTLFSHANGLDLQFSQCTLPTVSYGSDHHYHYTCSALAGSSGAGLLDDASSKAIGTHFGEAEGTNVGDFLGGTLVGSVWAQSGGQNVNGKKLWPQRLVVTNSGGGYPDFDSTVTTRIGNFQPGITYSLSTEAPMFNLNGSSLVGQFTVTSDGLLAYSPTLDGLLSGRGTHQLRVSGNQINLSAAAVLTSVLGAVL
jgi:hypothetical protein